MNPPSAFPGPRKGRASSIQPANRFEKVSMDMLLDQLVPSDVEELLSQNPQTEFLFDQSETIVSENDSPDIPFRYSINPYRGCEHGCSYCYARPTHEYLGFSAGFDFESKIVVKREAPRLLRKWLSRTAYQPEPIVFSGVTDCYQPCERIFRITRGCLEVAQASNQPVGIITKNALVKRDLDLLSDLAKKNLTHVAISITTLDRDLAQQMEPRTSTPAARLAAIQALSDAGVPVIAMIAPIIPGLNDHEIPALLQAVKDAGAHTASFTVLRLPYSVKAVFADWLHQHHPLAADKVLQRLESVRDGKLNSSEFSKRMSGTGEIARHIKTTFHVFRRKVGLDRPLPTYDCSQFQRPFQDPRQGRLF